MRAPATAAALLLVFLLLASPARAGVTPAATGNPPRTASEDFLAVGRVSHLINVTSTPQLEPGQSGDFVFDFNSTYPAGMTMYNVSLNISIYRYATIESSAPVDSSWSYPYPRIAQTGTREWNWTNATVAPGSVRHLSFTIVTAADPNLMPSGSVFSQASYFLRMWLTFEGNVSGNMTPFRMASLGYFSAARWALATNESSITPCNPPWCRGNLNLTILGVDGVLYDSSFGVKQPIPQWPFYLLIALAVVFVVLAFLFWVEENPGTYPRVETWWVRQRGRLARVRPRRRRKAKGSP